MNHVLKKSILAITRYLKSSPNSKSKGCHQKKIAEKETLVHSHLPPSPLA